MAFITGTQRFVCDKRLSDLWADELELHGDLLGNHFSWYIPENLTEHCIIEFFEDTPEEILINVLKVYENHSLDEE